MIKLEVKNLDELLQKFWALQVDKTLSTAVKKTIIFLEWQSKRETPVDTWILRNSYKSTFGNKGKTGELINFRKYWVYVHEGTKYIKGNPFITRAVNKSERQISVIWSTEINKMLKTLKT